MADSRPTRARPWTHPTLPDGFFSRIPLAESAAATTTPFS